MLNQYGSIILEPTVVFLLLVVSARTQVLVVLRQPWSVSQLVNGTTCFSSTRPSAR